MKLGDALQIIGVAAMISIGGVATIKKLFPAQHAIHDNDKRFLPASDIGLAQLTATEDASRVSDMPSAPIEKPQLELRPGFPKEIPQRKKNLMAVVKSADGTFKDVYDDEVPTLIREEDVVAAPNLWPEQTPPGRFPSEITSYLKNSDVVGADILEMASQIRTGNRTAKGDAAEQLLRNQLSRLPELRSLNFSVTCASHICELRAVRALPGMTTDSIETALTRVSSTKGFADQYRIRTGLQLPVDRSPYWIWYWEERE